MKRITTIIAAGLLVFGPEAPRRRKMHAAWSELLKLIEQGQARDSPGSPPA